MSNHSTITYFRTTLDPLDIYRLERIIDHGEDTDISTPAAALAVYLRGIDPSLRWHSTKSAIGSARGGVASMSEIMDKGNDSDLLYLDAAVFTHGTNRTIVMGLKPIFLFAARGPVDRNLWVNRPTIGRSDCLAWATSLPLSCGADYLVEFNYRPASSLKSKDAAWLADFTEPIIYLGAYCYSFQHMMGVSDDIKPATNAPAPEVAGFTQVPWDHDTWLNRKRPKPGMDVFADSSRTTDEDELTSIVSCIRQGDGIGPLVTIEVQRP